MGTETASPTSSITPVPLCNGQLIPEIQLETALGSDVLLAGTAYLCDYELYSALDLDRAVVGYYFLLEPEKNLLGADLYLSLATVPSEADIVSLEPAELANFDQDHPPSQIQCEAALQESTGFGILFFWWFDDITDADMYNEFACIRTDEGRVGYFHMEEANPLGEVSVKISFVVWKNDQDQ